jgi:toxin ParE1/3/4
VANVCRWTGKALQDLGHIKDYIAQDNPAAFVDTIRKIVLTIEEQLCQYPHSGRAGRVYGTRELIIAGTPYIAAYRVRGGTVEVLRILHNARKWPDMLT